MNFVRLSKPLNYQRFTPSDCMDIGIRKFEFVAKTQFFCEYVRWVFSVEGRKGGICMFIVKSKVLNVNTVIRKETLASR